MTHEKWMRLALEQASYAKAEGEVPVGCVIVLDDELIATGYNRPIATKDPTAHAEIVTLRAAAQRLGNYRLVGARLYTTLEPCVMCAGAIVHARIEHVIFAAFDEKGGAAGSVFDLLPTDSRFNRKIQCTSGILAEEASELLSDFFKKRRDEQKP